MSYRQPLPPVNQPPSDGMVEHAFERSWDVEFLRQDVWDWLNDPKTFTRGQPWPYFVEFIDGGFETGVLNTHTGPMIHFCGVIGEVRAPEYRDLIYLYGAYAIRMRWIRPRRLQFWVQPHGQGTRITMRLDSHVRGWLRGPWNLFNRMFWSFFGRTIRSGVRRRQRESQPKTV
jgi:hypothetical protein